MIRKFLTISIISAVSYYLFYVIAEWSNSEQSLNYGLIGAFIGAFSSWLVNTKPSDRSFDVGGTTANTVLIIIIVFQVAESPILWLLLAILSIPLYLYIARYFYGNLDSFLSHMGNPINDNDPYPQSNGELGWYGGYHSVLYFLICIAVVTAEYQMLKALV